MHQFIIDCNTICVILSLNHTKEQARAWLNTKRSVLGDKTPLDLIKVGDTRTVIAKCLS